MGNDIKNEKTGLCDDRKQSHNKLCEAARVMKDCFVPRKDQLVLVLRKYNQLILNYLHNGSLADASTGRISEGTSVIALAGGIFMHSVDRGVSPRCSACAATNNVINCGQLR